MTGVQIVPDTLRQAGNGLSQVCSELESELNKLESELSAMGEPWGNDDIGQLVGAAYQEVVAWAFDCLRDVLHELCESGTDLVNQATQWEEQEQQVETGFQQFLGQLGSA
jgi:hypothetical protein